METCQRLLLTFVTTAAAITGFACAAQSEPALPSWYVRGEFGGARLDGGTGNWLPPGRSDPRVFHDLSKPTTLLGGFALGYMPWRGVKTELSYFHLFQSHVSGSWVYTVPAVPGPHADMRTSVSTNLFMANAYIQPLALAGFDWSVQPFIGGGVGLALNRMTPWTRTNVAAPDPVRTFEGSENTRFAWNLAAGVSVSLARLLSFPLSLDLTYRYIDAGRVKGGVGPYPDLRGNIPRQAFNMPLRAHTWTAGLTMPIGDQASASGFGLARGGNFILPDTSNNRSLLAACGSLGRGFFLLPGTGTCLSVQGSVRAEYGYAKQISRTDNAYVTAVRGQAAVDARTPTAYGPLQTFLRLELNQGTGVAGFPQSSTPALDRAFVRFGGLLAGRAPSLFDYYANALNFSNIGGSDSVTNQLTYAIGLGGGYQFGIGVESSGDRATDFTSDYFATRRPPVSNVNFLGRVASAPNPVAALRYDGSGFLSSAQLSAALN